MPSDRPAPEAAKSADGDQPIFARRPAGTGPAWGAVAVAVALLVVAGFRFVPGGPLEPERDSVPEPAATSRAKAFVAASPLELRIVPPSEMRQAIASMDLPDSDRQLLERTLAAPGTAPAAVLVAAGAKSEKSAPVPEAAPQPVPAPAAVRLAWITLWDTDAQDGDVVRIDSSGFTRTVTLANSPVTFAVPVPAQGIVNVTGVRDGGGGITVGAMSSASRVSLPIMSVGQVLGVPVVAR